MTNLREFIRLTRPVFLLGGALLYGLGAALVEGPIRWSDYAIGQAMVTTVQLAAQYANEYFDVDADRQAGEHRTWLTGGSGVLVAGSLPIGIARRAAVISTVIALGLTVAVAGIVRWAGLIGLVALAGSWLYSAPPIRLVATWVGVAAASMIVAVLTPVTGALVNGSAPVGRVFGVVVPLWLLHNAMLIAFERPDVTGDAAAGKNTLSVRIGPTTAARLHGGLIGTSFVGLAIAMTPGPLTLGEAGWGLALAPVGLAQAWSFGRVSDTALATGALGLFAGTAIALLAGLA
jgi:1,4-dihydroxy-2-naphthoate octaprenyltransferase